MNAAGHRVAFPCPLATAVMQTGFAGTCPTPEAPSLCNLQGHPLSSPDGRVYLSVQGDGNLVLYDAQVVARFGKSYASAIFATGTYGSAPQPFSLSLKQVSCASSQAPAACSC